MLTEERVVRELLGGAPPCRRLSRDSRSARFEDQLGLEHKAYAEIEDHYATGS